MLTTQTLLHRKQFGNFLSASGPLEYRRADWQELNKGRERSVRLIVRAMLGIPSAHQGEQDHAMWCFQFPKNSILVLYLQRGNVVELAGKVEENGELEEAVDFIIAEVETRLKQL